MTARDGYERYYLEKLWALVPEVYRNADGSGALRELIGVIAEDAGDVRRSIDRLWEDQHIETSDDWAVPYIGGLVSARLVSAQDLRARRVDVANTVRFRRRRGTPELLETLTRALSGWDVVLEEGFRQLARLRHRLDGPAAREGFYTNTPLGGTADLRRPVGAEIAAGPFGEFFHSFDARRLSGQMGRFGVRKLNFHLYRLRAFEMTITDPVAYQDPQGLGFLRTYTFDPSGRAVPLYLSGQGSGSGAKDAFLQPNLVNIEPREWDVVQPMRCRLLNHVIYEITASAVLSLQALANPPLPSDESALNTLLGQRFNSEDQLRQNLLDQGASISSNPPDWYVALLAETLAEDCGKAQLYPRCVQLIADGSAIPPQRVSAGNLADPRRHPIPSGNITEAMIHPADGAFASVPADDPIDFTPQIGRYYYGFSAEVGAGPYARRPLDLAPSRTASDGTVPDGGVLQGDGLLFADNRTYDLTLSNLQALDSPALITVAPQSRPFVRLTGNIPTLQPAAIESVLMIDGGWFAAQDPTADLNPGETVNLTIEGAGLANPGEFDFDRVEIRFATLDPGGQRADGVLIPPLRLLIRARIRTLILRNAITGPIVVEDAGATDPSVVDELIVCRSIVDASQTVGRMAISNPFGRVMLEESTLFGHLDALRLDANASIVVGRIRVVNNQAGCFRFSATLDAPERRLPPGFKHFVGPIPAGFFNSRRFGDPLYAQLSPIAQPLASGAENGSEMGVFSHLLTPIKLSSIRAKVDEFGPVGQLAQYLFADDPLLDAPLDNDAGFIEPPVLIPPELREAGDLIPEPPEPAPAPLPTRCPDEPEPAEPEPVEPEPTERTRYVALNLLNADLNGAPEFWRGNDWLPDTHSEFASTAPARAGIPFDKIDYLIEYDARLDTRPEEQNWQPSGPVITRFRIVDGALIMNAPSNSAPAFFTARVPFTGEIPEQIHAYAVVAPMSGGTDNERTSEFFEVRKIMTRADDQAIAGLRAGWRDLESGLDFAYLPFESTTRLSPTSDEPRGELRSQWQRLSLQSDVRADRALLGIAGAIDSRTVSEFGRPVVNAGIPSIIAQFGLFNRGVGGRAALRNLVISAPGRFMRVLLRGVSPGDAPVLRLTLLADQAIRGTASFTVRYSDASDEANIALSGAEVTGSIAAPENGEASSLDVLLSGIGAGRALTMVITRRSLSRDDTLRGSLRLVGATLISREGVIQ